MLDPAAIERAVALQRTSYELLRWMADAVPAWTAKARHGERSLAGAIGGWLTSHLREVPPALRPEAGDVAATANLLASYLETTFDFDPSPGEGLYSPRAHCFCPMCSWLVELPRLRPRTLTRADKQRAQKLRGEALAALARADGRELADAQCEALLDDPGLRDELALVAYVRDLLRRLDGLATTPASLALWRGFAWTPEGSPRKKFVLRADAIRAAEQTLLGRLRGG